MNEGEPGQGMAFGNMGEIEHALANKVVTMHTKIKARVSSMGKDDKLFTEIVDTTPGRFILGQLLPKNAAVPYGTANQLMTKKMISKMIDTVYRACGQKETVIFCDRIMDLGFKHAARAGIQVYPRGRDP
jgi:DNA-directed RNA polymerase subunit beta'